MMKKQLNKIMLFAFVTFSLCGCSKFLEITPKSSISSENYFKTANDATTALNAVYANLESIYDYYSWYFGDVAADDATNGSQTGGLYALDYSITNSAIHGFWTAAFRGINYANLAIKYIPAISMDTATKSRYIAEAKFLRAIYYFNLLRAFGPVPEITEPTMDGNSPNNTQSRANTDQIYDLIVNDLKAAESILPSSYGSGDLGRATQGAAKSLLAKVYLYKGDFKNAREKSLEVIQSNNYKLYQDYRNVFKIENENGMEDIFSVQFKSGNALGGGSDLTSQFATRNPNILLNGAIAGEAVAAESAFFNNFPEHYRKSIILLDSFPSPYYPEITAKGKTQVGPVCMKYWDPNYGASIGGDANWVIIRYADILLVFAEAENEVNGPTPAAYNALNQIRKRARDANGDGIDQMSELAALPNIESVDQKGFRQAVWRERELELCFEGQRRWDLLRTGQFLSVMRAAGKPVEDKDTLFPIPYDELQVNPNLTQNPGYPN